MTLTLLVLLKICVVALLVAIGMGSTLADATYVWRRPGLLARSLLAMYVLVPLAVFAIVRLLPVSPAARAALLVLAVSAGAPLLPRKLGTVRGSPYVFSLVFTSSIFAIVLVPSWVSLLSDYFDLKTELTPLVIVAALAKAFLGPLAFGMVFHALWPKAAEWLADRLLAIAGVALIVCGIVLVATQWEVLLQVRWHGLVALFAALLASLAIGHALGGPEPEDRTALAIACATRHIGIAVLAASAFAGPRVVVPVATYFIASAIVSIPYLKWRRRQATRRAGAVTVKPV